MSSAMAKPDSDKDDQANDSAKSLEYRSPGLKDAARADGGFFHVYKSGQGYWTRMATAGAAALILAMTAYFLWQQLPAWVSYFADDRGRKALLGIIAAVIVGYCLLVWRLMNKPTNADFLIATDSEMKKVNWTSRKELIGSTKVVIIFMFLIALLLFGFDIFFGYLFYFMNVLKSRPL